MTSRPPTFGTSRARGHGPSRGTIRGGQARGGQTRRANDAATSNQEPEPLFTIFPAQSSLQGELALPPGAIQEWQPVNTLPLRGVNGEEYNFIDYSGSGLEFRLPNNVQLSELSKAIIDNIWNALMDRDIPKGVAYLNGACHFLAQKKPQSVYLLWSKERAGIYSSWPELVDAKKDIAQPAYSKADTLQEALSLANQYMPHKPYYISQKLVSPHRTRPFT
ncbi:hypothetical protein LOK49_LG14G01258 [Camellia lanceoleosa]|uniref:Uncharacterized protein n=1 Tax=Camellia lanceoleosa TaxID=1840588 RepID=A0ACC0F8M6_9ERIC|nr:hypothetical protein LOK49_LG14G01258 [Camellia lanceoleosa]